MCRAESDYVKMPMRFRGLCCTIMVLAGAQGVSFFTSTPEHWEMGFGHRKWSQDKTGWGELNRVVGAHMNAYNTAGLNMAQKIKIARGAAGEVQAIERTAKISGSLLHSASREEFFYRIDNKQVYVRNGTLYRSPAVDIGANLSALSDSELDVYALECGIPPTFFLRKLPQFLRDTEHRKGGRVQQMQPSIYTDPMGSRRLATQQQIALLLRGPVHVRLAYLKLAALRKLVQRFAKVDCEYTRGDSKIQLIRKLTHGKFRHKPTAQLHTDLRALLRRVLRRNKTLRRAQSSNAPDDVSIPAAHKNLIQVLEFADYAVRTFAESICILCRLRVASLYDALRRAGRAPGTGTAHGYLKGVSSSCPCCVCGIRKREYVRE